MFENTKRTIHTLHLLILTLSQLTLVAIPLFRLLSSPPDGVAVKYWILAATSLFLMIFNLIIESRDKKPTKKEKKFAKAFRKYAKVFSNFVCFVILLFTWYINDDQGLVVPLIFSSVTVVAALIAFFVRYAVQSMAESIKEDLSTPIERVKHIFTKKKKAEQESVASPIKQARITPVKQRTIPSVTSSHSQEDQHPAIEESATSPKKRFNISAFLPKKRTNETVAEALPSPEEEQEQTIAEAIAEALPAPEVEEVEAPAPEKKKNPLLAFLPKKKGKVPEDVHTEEGASEETLIK